MTMTEVIQTLVTSAIYTRIGGVLIWQDERPAPTVDLLNTTALDNGCDERITAVVEA